MSETLDSTDSVDARRNDMIYTIEDCPPWYLCVFLGLQVRQTWNLTVTVLGMYWKRLPGISHLCFHLQRWKGTWQNFTLRIMNQEKTQNVPSFNLNSMRQFIFKSDMAISNKANPSVVLIHNVKCELEWVEWWLHKWNNVQCWRSGRRFEVLYC